MILTSGQCARGGAMFLLAVMLAVVTIAAATAQPAKQPAKQPANPPAANPAAPAPPAASSTTDPMAVPGFWDPRRRPERPDLSRISIIRFLTEIDYPPFNYAGPDGAPAGFNVDLARLICEEIKVACTMQMRRFDTLIGALNSNNGDAVIASIAETPDMRKQVDFSDPYYRTPARFVARRDVEIDDVRPEALEGKKIAVVAGTAHEAYLKTLFTEAELHPYPNADAARFALKKGEVVCCSATAFRWRSGSTALTPPAAANSAAGHIWKPASSAKASASRSSAATTCCGRHSTGRCSGCGRRAASPNCGCAISRSARIEPQI